MMLIALAILPLMFGIIQLIQSFIKKTESDKKYYRTYGLIKIVIGAISGCFLSYIYLSYDFFTQQYGSMFALIICWFIINACNVVAHVKLGMEEYDRQQAEKQEEPKE